MATNSSIIEQFYTCFAKKDAGGMNALYSDDIIFSDPVFGLLKGEEVKSMWRMLCRDAKEFSLSFSSITELDEEYATCEWVASYRFSATGKKVVNRVKAFMRLKDGKIVEHSDAFKLSKWAAQALGWKGVLFGWSGFLQKAIQKKARKRLELELAKEGF